MPFRYKVLFKGMSGFDDKRLLDVGCGDYSPQCTQMMFPKMDYWGVDVNRELSTYFEDKDKFFEVDVEREGLPFEDNMFDIVVLSHVLEHLRDVNISSQRVLSGAET